MTRLLDVVRVPRSHACGPAVLHRRSFNARETALTCRLVLCHSSNSDSEPSRRREVIVEAAQWMLLETFSFDDNPALAEELARRRKDRDMLVGRRWSADLCRQDNGYSPLMRERVIEPLNIGERRTGAISAARASVRQT